MVGKTFAGKTVDVLLAELFKVSDFDSEQIIKTWTQRELTEGELALLKVDIGLACSVTKSSCDIVCKAVRGDYGAKAKRQAREFVVSMLQDKGPGRKNIIDLVLGVILLEGFYGKPSAGTVRFVYGVRGRLLGGEFGNGAKNDFCNLLYSDLGRLYSNPLEFFAKALNGDYGEAAQNGAREIIIMYPNHRWQEGSSDYKFRRSLLSDSGRLPASFTRQVLEAAFEGLKTRAGDPLSVDGMEMLFSAALCERAGKVRRRAVNYVGELFENEHTDALQHVAEVVVSHAFSGTFRNEATLSLVEDGIRGDLPEYGCNAIRNAISRGLNDELVWPANIGVVSYLIGALKAGKAAGEPHHALPHFEIVEAGSRGLYGPTAQANAVIILIGAEVENMRERVLNLLEGEDGEHILGIMINFVTQSSPFQTESRDAFIDVLEREVPHVPAELRRRAENLLTSRFIKYVTDGMALSKLRDVPSVKDMLSILRRTLRREIGQAGNPVAYMRHRAAQLR